MILYTTKKLLGVSTRIYRGRWEWLGRAQTLFEVGEVGSITTVMGECRVVSDVT
jgi:hypothetical protein